VHIGERSPARVRGRMISVDMIFIGTGSVLPYAFNSAFLPVPQGWRYMVSLGPWPSILLGLFLFTCPERPRQLMYHNKWEQCIEVIRQAYPDITDEQGTDKMMSVETDVAHVKALVAQMTVTRSLKAFFFVPANLRSAITACCIILFQRMCGFNTFMYFSSTPFDIVGFSDPIAVGTVVAGFKWSFTVLSILLIDRVGCRELLLWTMWGMPVCLIRSSSPQLHSTRHADSAADQR
jgi:SP family myo-inositol transporter-like MFS transporter 13